MLFLQDAVPLIKTDHLEKYFFTTDSASGRQRGAPSEIRLAARPPFCVRRGVQANIALAACSIQPCPLFAPCRSRKTAFYRRRLNVAPKRLSAVQWPSEESPPRSQCRQGFFCRQEQEDTRTCCDTGSVPRPPGERLPWLWSHLCA